MEERIIDDEYGRGIRLKKTKDGYVDVTDELAKDEEEPVVAEDEGDEIAFEFPMMDEDDEDLVGLSPEEALALRKKKAEEQAKRKAEYEAHCQEGETLLSVEDYAGAEAIYEKALHLDDEAMEASVGYWRAKTSDFKEPDVLIDEYLEAGIESLEFDLGYRATDCIRERYEEVFRRRIAEIEEEEKPLEKAVEEAKIRRRSILSKRVRNRIIAFCIAMLPFAASLILAVVFGMKNFTTSGSEYITPTIILACVAAVTFIPFAICTNRLINGFRMKKMNERLSATEDGQRLIEIALRKELYTCMLPGYLGEQADDEDGEDDEDKE